MQKRLVSLQMTDNDPKCGVFIEKSAKNDYDIILVRVPALDWKIVVEAFSLFHNAFIKAKKTDKKIVFIYDISLTEFSHISMDSVTRFAKCHRPYQRDYEKWLICTVVLFSDSNKKYAGTLNNLLQMCYSPVRPLKITADKNTINDFIEKANQCNAKLVENEIESTDTYKILR